MSRPAKSKPAKQKLTFSLTLLAYDKPPHVVERLAGWFELRSETRVQLERQRRMPHTPRASMSAAALVIRYMWLSDRESRPPSGKLASCAR